jgi:hypothetical protein
METNVLIEENTSITSILHNKVMSILVRGLKCFIFLKLVLPCVGFPFQAAFDVRDLVFFER